MEGGISSVNELLAYASIIFMGADYVPLDQFVTTVGTVPGRLVHSEEEGDFPDSVFL